MLCNMFFSRLTPRVDEIVYVCVWGVIGVDFNVTVQLPITNSSSDNGKKWGLNGTSHQPFIDVNRW